MLPQKTLNLYPDVSKEGKQQIALYSTPGLKDFSTVGTGSIRGSIDFDGILYMVVSDTLYRVNSFGQGTAMSTTLSTVSGRVHMVHNGRDSNKADGGQIFIVDGTQGYIYKDNPGSLSVITDGNFPANPSTNAFMDSYFLVNEASSNGRFRQSSSYDGTVWVSEDYDTAERDSDKLQVIIPSNRILWLLGEHTAEPFWNSKKIYGTSFEPVQAGFSQFGCISADTAVQISGTVLWLAQNHEGAGLVVGTDGVKPSIISEAIVNELQDLTALEDSYAWSYQYKGHVFYVLTFVTDKRTFVYDLTTQMWHEMDDDVLGYHRSFTHTFVYGKHIIGDPSTNKTYTLDWGTYTNAGNKITRLRRSRIIHADGMSLKHYSVWVDFKMGVGNTDVADPKVTLRSQADNKNWTPERTRSLGKIGQQNFLCIWRKMGRTHAMTYEIKVTDPCEVTILGAYANIQSTEAVTD